MDARSPPPLRTDDLIQPFQIETMMAQGRLVRLGGAIEAVLGAHDYPEPVAALLGECLAFAALLAGGIKYDGILTLQLKGDGNHLTDGGLVINNQNAVTGHVLPSLPVMGAHALPGMLPY